MKDDPRWGAVVATAKQQAGLVSRGQVLAHGFTAKEWLRLTREGRMRPVQRGVYALFPPRDWHVRELHAALLLAGEASALSHRTAARLHGLWGGDRAATPLEVIVPRKRRVAVPGANVYRSDLAESESEVLKRMRVTTLARTLVDLASVLDVEALAVAFESARRSAEFLPEMARRVQRPVSEGAEALRQLVADAEKRPRPFDSPFEVMFWRRVQLAGFERPTPQLAVETQDRRKYFIDFAWPKQGVAVELEGYAFHGAEEAFFNDKRRSAALAAAGYLYLPLTMERYRTDLAGFFRELRDALEHRVAKAA